VSARANTYAICFFAAAGLHAGMLYGWGRMLHTAPEFAMSNGQAVEVMLVEAAEPEMEIAAPPEPEPAPEPEAPPEELLPPEPHPQPEVQREPEPEPELVTPTPDPAPKPKARLASTPRVAPRSAAPPAAKPAQRGGGSPSGVPGASAGPAGVRTKAKPNYLSNPPPKYPAASRQAREQGVVILLVAVGADGRPGAVRLHRSSGYSRLDEAARLAVQRWRFSPARVGGIAVDSEVEVPVRFRL
jgi:protein TonB